MTQEKNGVALSVWSPLEDDQASPKRHAIQLEVMYFLPSSQKPPGEPGGCRKRDFVDLTCPGSGNTITDGVQ